MEKNGKRNFERNFFEEFLVDDNNVKDTSVFFYSEIDPLNLSKELDKILRLVNKYTSDEIIGFGMAFNVTSNRKISMTGYLNYKITKEAEKELLDNLQPLINGGIVSEVLDMKNDTTNDYFSNPIMIPSISYMMSSKIEFFTSLLKSSFFWLGIITK